jgi:nicotinamidase/pyrazinamidase
MKTALIVVDAQNDFMPGGSLAVPNGDRIVRPINEMTLFIPFDRLIFTKDYHPADHLSFASQHEGKKPFDDVVLAGISDKVWPDHCVAGTDGANIRLGIYTIPGEVKARKTTIINKGTDREEISYSGFFDNTGEKSTGLDSILKADQIKRVYVCGLAMDFCVFWTAKDAVKLGYETFVVLDATASIKDFDAALSELLSWTCPENGNKIRFAMSGGIKL